MADISSISQTAPSVSGRLTIGQAIFSEDYLLNLARTSGFLQRTPRKIDA